MAAWSKEILMNEVTPVLNTEMTPAALAALADDVEACAWADFYDAAPNDVRSALGIARLRVASATVLVAPGLRTPLFNRAIGLGFGESPVEAADIARIARAFASAGSPAWWLHLNPYARLGDLGPALEGIHRTAATRSSWAKMIRAAGMADRGRTTLRIASATDADVDEIVDAIARGFGLPVSFAIWMRALYLRPRWRLYGLFDGSEAVGGGALFLDDDQAWLGMGSVLASHRRRGGQRAVMAQRVNDATAGGAHWIATETGEPVDAVNPSLLNMRRCGFQLAASRTNLQSPPDLIGFFEATN